ncbi:hypothetical protein MGU_01568 [Metarhizium guizhouense ARSEF 977]|uniref:Uncharacterized protein n=1 Tax=Metarhizium guizhouense (strain ARSEF 977) TaxID=1276136 RepID=A0A0B4H8C3_METGA|nr:hypothetical protein MGU_01568 [Metarhizium guizhouense ARSEF 977]
MTLATQYRASDTMRKSEKLQRRGKATLKGRIAYYQWTHFTKTMPTGGMANVLHYGEEFWEAPK